MIDVLLKFPNYQTATQIGMALGYTSQNQDGTFETTEATNTLAICVIGEHFYPNGQTITSELGSQVSVLVGDGAWWVMVRSLVEMEIPAQIQPFIIQPNQDDPLIPNRHWA